jgi:hypothetical protein
MSVSKYKILQSSLDRQIDIPIEIKWDFSGREDSVEEYQKTVLEEVIGLANDFEIDRFSHNTYFEQNVEKTSINYEFYFYSGSTANIPTANITDYVDSYQVDGFTGEELYYYRKPFTKSFFKLDFYDTANPTTQKNYFTIILPVQQGFTENISISQTLPNVNVKKPKMKLDFIGDKEGFFIYWLRSRDFIDLSEFYMSAKFFNGRTGVFTTMINTPQFQIASPFTFNGENYFYYKVNLNYNNKTYEVFNPTNLVQRVGLDSLPIVWYEYVNPV